MSNVDYMIEQARGDPLYLRYLLVEYPYIRSALEAHGIASEDEDKVNSYSSSIGNALHNDVIELEMWLNTLTKNQVTLLFSWANNESNRRPPYSVRLLRRQYRERTNVTS